MIMHKTLADGRWFEFSLMEQLANIGSDIERTISWRKRGNAEHSQKALERALELIHFTIADPKNKKRLKELVRMREVLIDYFVYDNIYQSTDELWQRYFHYFSYVAAIRRGR